MRLDPDLARAYERTDREQALKLLPWICARCAREFPAATHRPFANLGKKLRGS